MQPYAAAQALHYSILGGSDKRGLPNSIRDMVGIRVARLGDEDARVLSAALFAEAFADGRRKRWRLNHSPLSLDFLEGKIDFQCTPWGI